MAYAAVVSLAQKLDKMKQDPNHVLHTQAQNQLFLTLYENVVKLEAIMENFPAKICGIEGRIVGCADHADDVIDAYFFDYSLESLHQELHRLSDETAAILEEVNRVEGSEAEEVMNSKGIRDHTGKDTILGFDDDIRILKERVYGEVSQLQVIPIVGMGGSGKTTLATALYECRMMRGHFDVFAWITVSQKYNLRVSLSQLLGDIKGSAPDDGNRSRILLTTRLEDVAAYTVEFTSCIHKVQLLDLEKSWCLLLRLSSLPGYCRMWI